MKFVISLSKEEIVTLEQLRLYGPTPRYRDRAHMILLSNKTYLLDEMADIFQVTRDAVSRCIERWEAKGIVGLQDERRSGRKPIISEEQRKIILKWVDENAPRSANAIADFMKQTFDTTASYDTIREMLKSADYSWKRLRKSLKGSRDQEAFEQSQKEIKELQGSHRKGDIDLLYFDASGFSLTPCVPYAWQKKGNTPNGCQLTEVDASMS